MGADGRYSSGPLALSPSKGTGGLPLADAMDPQSALRRSEERYRCLVQAISSVVWSTDRQGRVRVPQPGWADYTGQTWDEYRDKGWITAIHPEDRERLLSLWQAAIETGETPNLEGRLWHAPSGEHRHVIARGVSIREPDGQVREWIGTISDIHERKLAEEKNRALETRYRAIVEQSPAAVQVFRPDGLCITVNDTWERVWQAGRDLVEGTYNVLEDPQVLGAGYRSLVQSAFSGCVADIPAILYDPAQSGKPGRPRWIEGTMYPVRDAQGYIEEVVLVFYDVTARIEAEQERARFLEDRDEALGRLRHTLEMLPMGCATVDTDLNFTSWNPAAERIFGYTSQEVLGKHPAMIFMTHASVGLLQTVPEQLLREGGVVCVTAEHRRKDGAIINCEWHCSVLRNRDGAHAGFIAMCREVQQPA